MEYTIKHVQLNLKQYKILLFGGIKGFPLVAHQPTGCTMDEHKFTQKSFALF